MGKAIEMADDGTLVPYLLILAGAAVSAFLGAFLGALIANGKPDPDVK